MTTPSPPALNISVGATGAVPTPPAVIQQQLIDYLSIINPGYTVLPGALIEDILSTDVAAILLCDSAAIDLINSLTPDSANPWLLTKLGQMVGVQLGQGTNTSAFVVFTGTVGFIVPRGFTVSDGTYQYVVQDGGAVGGGGVTQPLYCLATQPGSWVVLANTIATIITSLPGGISLAVDNPLPGVPSGGAQTEEDYRAQVMQAQVAAGQGFTTLLKTALMNVPGVQPRLVSVLQVGGGGWEIIAGGGDPYAVGYAAFNSGIDISTLVGSTIAVTAITKANPGVVTTNLRHGLITGQSNVHLAGVLGMTAANGGPYTITKLDDHTFSFGVDTTGFGTYTSGGVVTPNARNVSVNLIDSPDTYVIPLVLPPGQVVTVQVTWNSTSPNFVSAVAVAQLGGPAVQSYVNSLSVGQPVNVFEAQQVFQQAIATLVPGQYLGRLLFTVTISGAATAPLAGTQLVYGDPESYFSCTAVTVTQG